MESKLCSRCKINQITRKRANGYFVSYCDQCHYEKYTKQYMASEKGKEVMQRYNASDKGKARTRRANVKSRERQNRWKREHSTDIRVCARKIAYEAKKCGLIKQQPCDVCGTEIGLQMHHDDYTKPMDVRWLCKEHHDAHHQQG